MNKPWYKSVPNLTFEERAYIAIQLDKPCVHGHARQAAYVYRDSRDKKLRISCDECHRQACRKYQANEWSMGQ